MKLLYQKSCDIIQRAEFTIMGNRPESPIEKRKVIKGTPQVIQRVLRACDATIQNRAVLLGDDYEADAEARIRSRRLREQIASEFNLPPQYRPEREKLDQPLKLSRVD